jgi:ParB/RepB/Spo0J family partition protein
MNTETIVRLKLKLLVPAAGNRPEGSGMDGDSLKELAASIKAQGILQPLLVRPHPTEKGKYEIIAGERRWTAAEKADLAEVPCLVRECSDLEARELRIIENLQRENLHPIEEARNYQALLDEKDADGNAVYDIKRLAERTGKSAAWVYAKLKLLRMPELAQEAMLKGKLNASVALLLCRIPDPKLAHKATCEVLDKFQGKEDRALAEETEPMSFRDAKTHIQRKYMIRLKGAAFDQEDAELLPQYDGDGKQRASGVPPEDQTKKGSATGTDGSTFERGGGGKCSDCPFRTGNMKALFPDAESADVCTNTPCFQKKVAAHQKRETAKFADKGQTLLKPKVAERLLNYEGTELNVQARQQFVPLNETVPGKRTTWGELLEKWGVEHEVVVAKGKKTIALAPITPELAKAVKEAGVKLEVKTPPTEADRHAVHREQQVLHAAMEGTEEIVLAELGKQLRLKKFADDVKYIVVADLLSQSSGSPVTVKMARKLDEIELWARLFENTLSLRPFTYQGELRDEFVELAKQFEVDVKGAFKEQKSVAAVALAEAETLAAAAPPTEPAAKKKKK